MSRKEVISNNRCPVCGGKMRLVNVTWTNTFRTPEASQYDLSVSNRKAMLGNVPASSSMEMMCSNCCRRSPVEEGKKKKKGEKKNRAGKVIGWIIFIVALAVVAYFVYKYRDIFGLIPQRLGDLWNKAVGFFTNLFNK